MSHAVRLHGVQFVRELFGKGLGNFLAEINALLEILLRVRPPDLFVERGFQFIEVFLFEIDTRRLRMTAEFRDILRTIFNAAKILTFSMLLALPFNISPLWTNKRVGRLYSSAILAATMPTNPVFQRSSDSMMTYP